MATPLDAFQKVVVSAGILSADELRTFVESLPATERPTDGDGLAKLLVAKGKLTAFQSQHLLAGRGGALTVGEYLLVERIGAGGMGQVFKARHLRMQRIVALKMMSPEAMKDEAAVRRFQREVRAAARLEHLNIVTAYDAGQHGKNHYLVMQFVDGGDLANLVKAKGPLPVDRAVNFIAQAARGLAFAHGEKVVHRDIKPANLLVDKKGCVKILDMGLARLETGNEELTGTEQVMGTADYMSPEQASDTKNADARSDIYSLGCTLWFLLTGKRLYDGDTMISRLIAHRDAPLPSLMKVREDVPWSLEQALHKMIAKRADERFQTMDEVVAALDLVHSNAGAGPMGSSVLQDADLAHFLSGIGQGGASRIGGGSSASGMRPGSSGAMRPGSSGVLRPSSSVILPGSSPSAASGIRPGSSSGMTQAMASARGDTDSMLGRRNASESAVVADDTAMKRKIIFLVGGGVAAVAIIALAAIWTMKKPADESTTSTALAAAAAPRGPKPPSLVAPFDAATAKTRQQEWASHLGIPVVSQNSIGMRFVLIPPGEYLMGSTPGEIDSLIAEGGSAMTTTVAEQAKSEGPQHRVVLTKPLLMGETEVTIAQFAKFVEATLWKTTWEHNNPTHPDSWKRPAYDAPTNVPATRVDRGDAAAFCNWLSASEKLPHGYEQSPTIGWIPLATDGGYRLPTEGEWEFACRAGTTTPLYFGKDAAQLVDHAWVTANSQSRVQSVAAKKPNPFGLYDMYGNVQEWCLDAFDFQFYRRTPTNDPLNLGTSHGIFRGGHCTAPSTVYARSAYRRSSIDPYQDRAGFRVVRAIDLSKPFAAPALAPAVAAVAPPPTTVITPSAPKPATPVTPAVTPATTSGRPVDIAAERKAAEWVLSKSGSLTIGAPGQGTTMEVSNVKALPTTPFTNRRVGLNDKRPLNDPELRVLAPLAEVAELQLNNTGITGKSLQYLADLTTLRTLALDGSKANDAELAVLAKLNQLQRLELYGTRVSEDGLERLPIGNLTFLKVGGFLVGNRLTTLLRDRAPNIASLYIVDSGLTNTGMAALGELKKLSTLELSGGSITDAGIDRLTGSSSLRSLTLRNLGLGDVGLKKLSSLKGLTTLKLYGMQFGDAALAATHAALPTTEILINDAGMYAKNFPAPTDAAGSPPANTLTAAEQSAGWKLLFDGKSLSGWKKYGSSDAPRGWWAVDGQLRGDGNAGYIVTIGDYGSYELSFEFRGTPDANSGVNYGADDIGSSPGGMSPEYELDADSPTSGGMWDGGPQSGIALRDHPTGWFRGQITVLPGQARHVLVDPNGKTLFDKTYVRSSAEYKKSKKGTDPIFWRLDHGKIALQSMAGSVAFRNIKIRQTK